MTDTAAQILRYEIPVDDQWHTLTLPGPIVHVASRRPDTVEVWSNSDSLGPYQAELRVYGTGHPFPAGGEVHHRGTAVVPGGALVWHLLQRGPNRPVEQP